MKSFADISYVSLISLILGNFRTLWAEMGPPHVREDTNLT